MSLPTDSARWNLVKSLFDEALQRPEAQREAWLRELALAPEVREELLSLLAHSTGGHEAAPGFLEQAAPTPRELGQSGWPGMRCGSWELLEPIGSGGMGEVFRACRADGAYEGQAAVKLLKRGMDSAQVLARFAQEQQTLARLEHPHIARLFDAGLSELGLPYFVMELVQGRPLDQACANLSLEQRLQLFLQLADAVAYAHRNLLVHRDLKPGNVLVNEQGQVKLLDFGIAKALDPLASADAGQTRVGERPYTPHYASPEQVRGEPVNTATDIYSLGVLLYLMLTGVRPYGRQASTPAEAAHSVLMEEPTRPSTLGPEVVSDAGWLATRQRLRGDLDKIVLKALEKPLERRYASVDALASDVRAYLGGYPVSARAPSWGYVTGHFIRRHRLPVALSGVAMLALIGGLIGTVWQMHEAEVARAQAERRFAQVRQLANKLVFNYHDQIASLPGATQVREALLSDAVGYLDGLNQELGQDRRLARELAESYSRIAALQGDAFSPSQERLALAEQNLDKALALLPRYLDSDSRDLEALNTATEMWQGRALLHSRAGRLQRALDALEQGGHLSARALALGPGNKAAVSQLATLKGRMALVLGGNYSQACLGRVAEAGAQWLEALALFEQLVATEPESPQWLNQLAWARNGLASWAILNGDGEEALRQGRLLIGLRDRISALEPNNGNYQQQAAMTRSVMAAALSAAGRPSEGLPWLDQAEVILHKLNRQDGANRAAGRDAALLQLIRARTQHLAEPGVVSRLALQNALRGLPDSAELHQDFYMTRWRAEALIWNARAHNARPADAEQALSYAEQAQALLKRLPDNPDNANQRWMLAQALGEQAQAQRMLGRDAAARSSAGQAMSLWGGGSAVAAPAYFKTWIERDRRSAAGS